VFQQTTPHAHIIALAYFVTFVCAGWSAPGAAQQSHTEVTVEGPFHGKKIGKPAKDLSGIACRPLVGGEHACLVVNDESPFAQLATVRDHRLIASPRTVDLIAGRGTRLADTLPPVGVFGSEAAGRPAIAQRCRDRDIEDDFDEFDGEGVAWASRPSGGVFYVVGSHSCGRNQATRRRSTHLLARFQADGDGRLSEPAELTWRLGEVLRQADPVSAHYGLPLDRNRQGVDIEGIAALGNGDDLLFGLRAPSLDGHAFIVRAHAADLFGPDAGVAPPSRVIQLPLGEGAGIRDLAALPDGRLLVLSGPAQDQTDVPQRLSLVAPSDQPVWEARPLLPRIEAASADAKAEGLAVLATADGTLRVLILFEDPAKDPPLEYILPLPTL
jgi:hypothetical protein